MRDKSGINTSTPAWEPWGSAYAYVDRAVTESFSFRRAHAISPERVRWFYEGTDGSYPVINVGFDEGTHYTRSATLRVREHGVVDRQEMRDDGELIWIADR